MMLTYNIHEAKTHFSKLIEHTQNGEEILIAKAGKPVAILKPISDEKPRYVLGVLKGQIRLGTAFNDPLPEEILDGFEGNL